LILPYFKKNIKFIIAGIVSLILVDILQLLIPYLAKLAIDIIAKNQNFELSSIIKYSIIITGIGILAFFFRYIWRICLIGTARYLEKGIRKELFIHILKMDSYFFSRFNSGDIMTHATSDINHIRLAFGMGIVALTDSLLLGISTISMMCILNIKLTILSVLPLPFIIIITRYMGRKMHILHRDAQQLFSSLTEKIRESFFGIRIIKIFNFQEIADKRIYTHSKNYYKKNLKRAVITAMIRPLMIFFLNLSLFIIIFQGGKFVIDGELSPGDLVAFIQYLSLLAWPVIAIGWMTNLVQRGLASLKRIESLLKEQSTIEKNTGRENFPDNYDIKLKNISFSYDKNTNILKDIDLSIKSGEFIGITGPPGSGKSTLLYLLARIYEPDSGKITIDQIDISKVSLEALKSKIAFMPQESFIFTGKIVDNITLGRQSYKHRLDQTINLSNLENTISNMNSGLDTIVGERGVTLSGGQKQRIAIARSFLKEKKIIIMDDPVSQVDSKTACSIISNILDEKKESTLIIVSHRLSAIQDADKIIIMKDGRIEAEGKHFELVEKNEFYNLLNKIQHTA